MQAAKRFSALIGVAAILIAHGAGAVAATKLTIGQASVSATGWPAFVAEDQGWFKRDGLDPEMINVGSVVSAAQQTIAGSLDIGYTNFEEAVQAIQAGAPITLVGSTIIKYPYSLMAAKTLHGAADLKGTKVILPQPRADVANFFDMWLADNHVAGESIDRVYDGSSTNRYAALVAGVVSAAAINSPLDFKALKDGFVRLVDFGNYVQHYGFVGLVVRKDWLYRNQKTLALYLADLAEGVDWLYDPKNERRAVDILRRATKQPQEVAQDTYDYYIKQIRPFSRNLDIPDADLMNVVAAMTKIGRLKPDPGLTPARFLDLSYLPGRKGAN